MWPVRSVAARSIVTLGVILCLLAVGCTPGQTHLPPPEPPARVLPRLANRPGPIPAGTGRVAIDVVDGRALVSRVRRTTDVTDEYSTHEYHVTRMQSLSELQALCVTPCVLDLPYGDHELRLQSEGNLDRHSSAILRVGAQPSIFRHAVGHVEPYSRSQYAWGLGLLMGGLTVTTLGVPTWALAGESGAPTGARGFGIAATVSGVAALVVGLLVLRACKTKVQPGSSVQWTPADGTIIAD